MSPSLIALLIFILGANAFTYLVYRDDKRRAFRGDWRYPERWLLTLALLGGSAGAKAAQHLLRHKTRKQPFGRRLNRILALQICVLVLLALPERLVPRFYGLSLTDLIQHLTPPAEAEKPVFPRRFGPGS
jgi:uncharacterized membrane protein YsdA (DUF1294 family)